MGVIQSTQFSNKNYPNEYAFLETVIPPFIESKSCDTSYGKWVDTNAFVLALYTYCQIEKKTIPNHLSSVGVAKEFIAYYFNVLHKSSIIKVVGTANYNYMVNINISSWPSLMLNN
jgi:hypothetical protein